MRVRVDPYLAHPPGVPVAAGAAERQVARQLLSRQPSGARLRSAGHDKPGHGRGAVRGCPVPPLADKRHERAHEYNTNCTTGVTRWNNK
eukprot:6209053-Pyramimonas_sp.AAC.1